MKWFFFILSCLTLAVAGSPTSVHADGSEVVVIYNATVPESKSVADHYADVRSVPTNQVFGFALSTGGDMSRAEFRDMLLTPLVRALTNAGLAEFGTMNVRGTNGTPASERRLVASKIRYAVLCYGVPWRIKPDTGLYEADGETLRPELRRNEAAVDSELACLPICERPYPCSGPLGNPLFGTTNAAFCHPTNGVLLVARLDGPTPEIARTLVDEALGAERDGLWGRAYFDLRGNVDPSMKLGEDWLRGASEICRHLGFETIVDTNEALFAESFPMSQIAFYAGWYRENATGPFVLPHVEFMPGAFAYHLHSFSAANLRTSSLHWVGPLLAAGAAATMGCVYEPYLGGTPDMAVFTARFIFHGFSFGEAAYAAQTALSWQTTVVGDPLYRPFGGSPAKLHDDLERRRSRLAEWSHLRLVNLNLARGAATTEMVRYLESTDLTRQSAVLTEKLGDLLEAQGKPASSVHSYEQALKLSPSPQQRVRLSLRLAEKLPALDREAEAYAVYQGFLKDSPDYADKPAIYRKLIALAAKLGKPEDKAKYQGELDALLPPPPATNSVAK